MTYAILLAGGIGSRVGADVPKQFIEVNGKPVIAYTMQRLQQHPEIDAILLVCVRGFEEKLRAIAEENCISKATRIVTGGADYEHSIMNGVASLAGIAQPDDVVMVHWAASPFVTDEIIADNIRVCRAKGNAMSACPAYLLYGTNDGDHAGRAVDRNTFMVLSAPQSFLYRNITAMYEEAERQGLFARIEPHTTTLMAELGIPVYFSKGSQRNIKITTKDDVELFEKYSKAMT